MLTYSNDSINGEIVLSVHDQVVAQAPIEYLASERRYLEDAMNGAFQEVLRYKVISDESIGYNFAEL